MDFIKRFIAMFLAVTMMVQMIPIPVFAQELSQDNSVIEQTDAYKDGDFLYTENADGTVCISGYTGEAGEEPLVVRVPDLINGKAVTKIGEEAFAYNTEIKGIIVPASVTSIDNAAFYHCENLQALAFLGRCPATGFTIVEGDHNIKKIFTPAGADLSMLCAVIVNDIGEEEAGAIEIVECEDLVQLNFAFDEFIDKESVNNVAEEVIQNTDIESSDPVEDTTGESTECNHIDIWYDYDETHHWKVCDDCGYEFDRKEHYGGIPRPGAGKKCEECHCEYGEGYEVTTEAQLKEYFSKEESDVAYVTADMVFDEDFTLPAGKSLNIGKLVINEGVTVTLEDGISDKHITYLISSDLICNGTIVVGENAMVTLTKYTDTVKNITAADSAEIYVHGYPTTAAELINMMNIFGRDRAAGISSVVDSYFLCLESEDDDFGTFEIAEDVTIPDGVSLQKTTVKITNGTLTNNGIIELWDSDFKVILGENGQYNGTGVITVGEANAEDDIQKYFENVDVKANFNIVHADEYDGYGLTLKDDHIHNYSAYESDAEGHQGECSECGLAGEKTAHSYTNYNDDTHHWSECIVCHYVSEKEEHRFDTFTADYGHYKICSICSMNTVWESHILQISYDDRGHWWSCSECSYSDSHSRHNFDCIENDATNHWTACTVCDATTERIPHNFNQLKSDDTTHWYECETCRQTSGVEAHSYGSLGTDENYEWKICKVCSAEYNRYPHSNVSQYNETFHWTYCMDCGYTSDYYRHNFVSTANDENYHWLKCTDCDATTEQVAHNFNRLNTDGTHHWYQCDGCSQINTKEEHNITTIEGTAATCTQTGLTDGKQCSVCEVTLVEQVVIDKMDHNISVTQYDDEYHWTKCATCDETTEKVAHTIEILPAVEPTCTTTGLTEGKKCSVCDVILVEQEEIDVVGHDFSILESNQTSHWHKCSKCDEITVKNDHEVTEIPGYDATCQQPGLTDGYYCSECEYVMVEQEEIPVTYHSFTKVQNNDTYHWYVCEYCGEDERKENADSEQAHTPEIIPGKDATCTEPGLTESSKCNACGYIITAQEETPVGDHKLYYEYDENNHWQQCEYCHNYEVPEEEHTGKIVPAVEPTCTQVGRTEGKVCSYCGYVMIVREEVAKLDHIYDENGICTLCTTDNSVANGVFSGKDSTTDDFKWRLAEDGTLYIDVLGEVTAMPNYTSSDTRPWQDKIDDITKVVFDDRITAIGRYTLYNYTNITNVKLPANLVNIGTSAFSGCSGWTGGLTLPDGVTTIGTYAFKDCTGLTGEIVLSQALHTVGANTFESCGFTGELILPDGLKTLSDMAFFQCKNITKITLGSEFSNYGTSQPFRNMTGVVEMVFKNPTPPTISSTYFNPFSGLNALKRIYVPAESYNNYCNILGQYTSAQICISGATEDFVIEDGVLIYYNGTETDVVIPQEVTSIGNNAFKNNKSITSVTFHDNVTSIGTSSFHNCTGLTGNLTLPANLTSIGSHAFDNCQNLTGELILPESLTSIGEWAFYNCKGFTGDLIIPDSVRKINYYVFMDCTGFNGKLKLPEGMYSSGFGNYAFSGCGFTGELVIPENITYLSSHELDGLSGITSIVFGESFGRIEGVATGGITTNPMGGMTSVKEITFKGRTPPTIYTSSLYSLTGLETINVPADSYDAYVTRFSAYADKIKTDFFAAKPVGFNADKVYSRTVVLSWQPSRSERVIGYKITRNGEEIGDITECTFTDTQAVAGENYIYTVYGYDENGEITGVAETTATPLAPVVLDISTDHSRNEVNDENNIIYISANDSKNLQPLGDKTTDVKLYYEYNGLRSYMGKAVRDEAYSETAKAKYDFVWDIAPLSDGDYTIIAEMTDVDGAIGTYSETVTIDRRIPGKISDLLAIGDLNKISLNWSMAAEIDTVSYKIYRKTGESGEFRLLTRINNRSTLTYSDTDVSAEDEYYYYIAGVNEYGQEGTPSDIAGATLADDMTAPVVTKITPVNGTFVSKTMAITAAAEDNLAVTKIEIFYSVDDGATWTMVDNASYPGKYAYVDTKTLADGEIKVKAVAYDAAGNVSDPMVNTYFVDNTGPSQVTGLEFTATSVTATLRWNDVTDNDVAYFRVEQKNDDGTYKFVATSNALGYNIYNLLPNTVYTYRVIAYDRQGNPGVSSEDIVVTTQGDTTAPVITSINPKPGYYSEKIDLSITAKDEYAISKVEIQVTTDGANWETVYTNNVETANNTTVYTNYELLLDNYSEGSIYVRGVVTDTAGNISDIGISCPYVQYVVDKTAPVAPLGVSVTANDGYNEIKWTQSFETDLDKYFVYRSTEETGEYTLISSNIAATNCFDREVEGGVTYYYKVQVNDEAGNLSSFSEVVTVTAYEDTEAPVIRSIYPDNGSAIGPEYKTVSALVTDNRELDYMMVEYSVNNVDYIVLKKVTNIDTHDEIIEANMPIDEFYNGDTVYVRISAADLAGNIAEIVTAEYTVDLSAPVISNATAVYSSDNKDITLTWRGGEESDLRGYRIYRKTGESGKYNNVGQLSVISGQMEYIFNDDSIPLDEVSVYYKIEAVDRYGNTSVIVSDAIELTDRTAPVPVINCDSAMETYAEYVIDATRSTDNSQIVKYEFDFGDGTTSGEPNPVHFYELPGSYTITLTVTDDDGNTATIRKVVSVKEKALIGIAKIRVVDENGKPVSNAPVYFDLGEEYQVIRGTDANGYAKFTAEVGKHTIGCVIANNEWLPAKKDIIITAGEETTVSLTMVYRTMIEGKFEVERMTFEEIIAAGIDASKPENQYIVRVNFSLKYQDKLYEASTKGNPKDYDWEWDPIIIIPDKDNDKNNDKDDDDNTGTNKDNDDDDEKGRVLYPTPIGGAGYEFSEESPIALLDLPVDVSSLKEMFDVNLHIINNASSQFSMLDNDIRLNVPKGLSIMETYTTEAGSRVSIAEIRGQTQETINWILRGDEVGEYYISADYSGTLSQFNRHISTQFKAGDPIEVLGLTNLKLKFEIAEELDKGTLYYNVNIANEGKIDLYRPSIETGDTLIETQLFDEAAADITEKVIADAEMIYKANAATSIEGVLDKLPAGYRIVKHYVNTKDTTYTEMVMELQNYAYTIRNTYGLEIEIVERPLNYFKSNLSVNINPLEKVEKLFDESGNENAAAYLINNENFIYWSMFSQTGEVSTALTSNTQETLWNLLKLCSGDGGFKELFGGDDPDLIRTIILDAMELNSEAEDYSGYHAIFDWTKAIALLVKDLKNEEFYNILVEWVNEHIINSDVTPEVLGEIVQNVGDSIRHTYEVILTEYRWELYSSYSSTEVYCDFENFYIEQINAEFYEYGIEQTLTISETGTSSLLHKIFSSKTAKEAWEGIGIGTKLADDLITGWEKTTRDISMYVEAQANINNFNLFLDTVITSLKLEKKDDAKRVLREAEAIKATINNLDIVGSALKNCHAEVGWTLLDKGRDKIMDKLGFSKKAILIAIKAAMKLSVAVGDNIFNVSERHNIADNIRFVSWLSKAMTDGAGKTGNTYINNKTEDNALKFLQILSFLANLRTIGESQVAQFGMTYEVMKGVFDSEDLFYAVRNMSGAYNTNSWIEWRDYVTDKITDARITIFRNPVTTDVTGLSAPIVTFDYANNRTAQTFTSDYEYSLDGGITWIVCDGNAIIVQPQQFIQELKVRRVDYTDTTEKMTGKIMIYAPTSLTGDNIRVLKTQTGYRLENLDNDKDYEVTFSDKAVSYNYGDPLNIAIPSGSYSYEFNTDETISYVYVRAISDAKAYATYVYTPNIYPMSKINIVNDGRGYITGADSYEYGEEAVLTATNLGNFVFTGWSRNGEIISTEKILRISADESMEITAMFVKDDALKDWVINSSTGRTTGVPEKTPAKYVIAYFHTEETPATVKDASGNMLSEDSNIGTGAQVIVGDITSTLVVKGDVDGDAEVTIFDCFDILDYVATEQGLEGAYYEAGCMSGGNEISIFDYYDTLDYMETELAS